MAPSANEFMRSITPQSVSPGAVAIPPMQGLTGSRPALSLRMPQSQIGALNFTQLPGAAVSVAASPDGTFWVLSTQGLPNGDKYIYHYVGGTFVNVPGAASRIAVGPDGTPWVINAAGGIYHLVNGVFLGIAGAASELSVGGTASAPLVDVISNQFPGPYGAAIYQYNVNAATWSQLPGAGVTVAASIDSGSYPALNINPGGFYVTNRLGGIYYYNAGIGFEQLPGGAISLAPTATGGIFALGDPTNPLQHGIYYNDLSTGTWTQMPGAAVSISANASDVYAIGAAGGIYVSPITAATSPSSVAMADPVLVQFVGDTRSLSLVDANGNAVTATGWTSADTTVATISTSGQLKAASPGSTIITATSANGSATASITVTGSPATISDVVAHFPLVYKSGPVTLASDISTAFTQQNGAWLSEMFAYYSNLFSKSYGGQAVIYYTNDLNLYAKLYAFCPNGTTPGTVNTSYTLVCDNYPTAGVQAELLVPDVGYNPGSLTRMLDEVGHQFIYTTYPESISYTWVYEGLGTYFACGALTPPASLVVTEPCVTYTQEFQEASQQAFLVPLSTLLYMPEATFYTGLYSSTNAYGLTPSAVNISESDLFFFYLAQKQPQVFNGLISQWDSGSITTNDQTVSYITAQTGMSLSQLDAAYRSYALTLTGINS